MEKKQFQYRCLHCLKIYKRKSDYEQHQIMCEILHKTQSEKQIYQEKYNDIPSIKELYDIILHLTVKCDTLEKKVEELSKCVDKGNKKINITEWLLMQTREEKMITYDEWIDKINIEREDIEYIFKTDIIEGLVYVLKKYIRKSDKRYVQLKAFHQKENIIYVYIDNEKKWNQLSYEFLSYLISKLNKQIMGEFLNWQKEYKEKMDRNEYSELYIMNFQKIVGSKYTQEQIKTKVKKELYNYLKIDISDMINSNEMI